MTILKKLLLICISILEISSLIHCQNNVDTRICHFNPQYDTQPILDLFEQDWHRLIQDNDKSLPPFMLKHLTHDTNPHNFGSLHIKVLRENNQLAGFVAYYIEKPQKGQILFLAVGHNFRGKSYGKMLMQYAMKELFSMGADHITLWTEATNVHAHRVYESLGFKGKLHSNNIHMLFTYWPE